MVLLILEGSPSCVSDTS
jgi:hypothetical protein